MRGGEISKGITRKGNIYSLLKTKLSEITGAIGCLTFQLFYDGNECIMIEINPRFGGGYPLSYGYVKISCCHVCST